MKFCLYKKKCEFCENIVINNFEIDMYSLVFSGTELQKLTTQYERRSLGLNREEGKLGQISLSGIRQIIFACLFYQSILTY